MPAGRDGRGKPHAAASIDVSKSYPTAQGPLPVLRGVSLELAPGREPGADRRVGQRQEHAPAPRRRARRGRRAARSGRRHGGDRGSDDAGRAALRRGAIGLVFQQFNLIPSLDVAGNLALPGAARRPARPRLAGASSTARLGLGGAARPLPRAALGRPAAAGGDRPGAGRAAGADPRRRADRQPRRGDRRRGDGRCCSSSSPATGASLLMVDPQRAARRRGSTRAARLHGGRLA